MEVQLVQLVEYYLSLHLHSNATFLAERLFSHSASEDNRGLLASTYANAGDFKQAATVLEHGNSPNNRYLYARFLVECGSYQEAEDALLKSAGLHGLTPQQLRQAIRSNPMRIANGSAGVFQLAVIAQRTDRIDRAAELYELALHLDPFMFCAYEALAWLGRAPDAAAAFNPAKVSDVAAHPANASLLQLLQARAGNVAEAGATAVNSIASITSPQKVLSAQVGPSKTAVGASKGPARGPGGSSAAQSGPALRRTASAAVMGRGVSGAAVGTPAASSGAAPAATPISSSNTSGIVVPTPLPSPITPAMRMAAALASAALLSGPRLNDRGQVPESAAAAGSAAVAGRPGAAPASAAAAGSVTTPAMALRFTASGRLGPGSTALLRSHPAFRGFGSAAQQPHWTGAGASGGGAMTLTSASGDHTLAGAGLSPVPMAFDASLRPGQLQYAASTPDGGFGADGNGGSGVGGAGQAGGASAFRTPGSAAAPYRGRGHRYPASAAVGALHSGGIASISEGAHEDADLDVDTDTAEDGINGGYKYHADDAHGGAQAMAVAPGPAGIIMGRHRQQKQHQQHAGIVPSCGAGAVASSARRQPSRLDFGDHAPHGPDSASLHHHLPPTSPAPHHPTHHHHLPPTSPAPHHPPHHHHLPPTSPAPHHPTHHHHQHQQHHAPRAVPSSAVAAATAHAPSAIGVETPDAPVGGAGAALRKGGAAAAAAPGRVHGQAAGGARLGHGVSGPPHSHASNAAGGPTPVLAPKSLNDTAFAGFTPSDSNASGPGSTAKTNLGLKRSHSAAGITASSPSNSAENVVSSGHAAASLPIHPSALPQQQSLEAQLRAGADQVLSLLKVLGSGLRHLSRYQCATAIKVFESLPPAHRTSGWVLSALGRACYESNKHRKAKAIFELMRRVAPERIGGLEYYSSVLWHLKAHNELTYLAQQLLQLDRRSPQAWCVAANAAAVAESDLRSKSQARKTALAHLDHAIRLDPFCVYAHTLKGHELYADGQLDEAASAFQEALRIDPRSYGAWYGLGTVLFKQDLQPAAEAHYRSAVEIHPNSSVLLVYLGMVLASQQKHDEALKVLDRAGALDPSNPHVSYQRSSIFAARGQHDAARIELLKVYESSPREITTLVALGKVCKKVGRLDEAVRYLNLALERVKLGLWHGGAAGSMSADTVANSIRNLLSNLTTPGAEDDNDWI